MERTFAFIDLAGFTALTEAHGDHEAAELVARFVQAARDALAEGDALVKSLGDAVMLVSPGPSAGLALVRRVQERLGEFEHFPLSRAGLHHGEAVERDGDWYGGAVNLAARVAAQASAGRLLCTRPVADAARAAGEEPVDLGPFRLRYVREPVDLYELAVAGLPQDLVVDPVCHMLVERHNAAGRLRYCCREYLFCSLECVQRFAAAPSDYV